MSGTTTVADTFVVTVTVTDPTTGSDFETFDWVVVGNDDPVLDAIADPQSSSEGDTVALTVSATDDNGDDWDQKRGSGLPSPNEDARLRGVDGDGDDDEVGKWDDDTGLAIRRPSVVENWNRRRRKRKDGGCH